MEDNYDEWEELTRIMNNYMNDKGWNVSEGLNYMKSVLVSSANVWGVKKHIFDKHCDGMKEDFDKYSEND